MEHCEQLRWDEWIRVDDVHWSSGHQPVFDQTCRHQSILPQHYKSNIVDYLWWSQSSMFALIRIICMTNDQLTIIVCNKMQIMLQRQKSLASKWFGMCRSLFLILICHYISKSDLYEQSWESTGWLFTVLLRHVSWWAPPCTLISVSLVVRSRELRFIIDLFSLTLIIMMQMSWSVVVDHTCSHYNITIYTYFAGISQTCKYYKLWRHWAILNIFRKWFQTITENLINYIKKKFWKINRLLL